MYLKSLDIHGFKSFADRISLKFNPGITAVVGPNGSGKSNIADAVRWVLGEQSAKTLRGTKMEDVIFSGTEHRKPLGYAEVSITIDNSDSALPVEFSEVTITRRVFRSGESEYFINKTPCRLKDIHELFLDTGIGREGYSIIGQGRIDEILSTRAEDRRHIFEEASGIMKYKLRKIEAERKLELTRQNLVRINDIIAELENQLEPLREQSETAKKYLSLRESLRDLEVNVYIENISRLRNRIKEMEDQCSDIGEQIKNKTRELEDLAGANREKSELLKTLEDRINTARQEFYNIENSLEKNHSEIRLNDEKINNLKINIERLEKEIAELHEKAAQLDREAAAKLEKLEYLRGQHRQFSARLEESQKKYEQLLESLDESERYMEQLKQSVMDRLDLVSDKKLQIGNIKVTLDNITKRKNSIDNEIYNLKLENDREKIKKEDISENLAKTAASINYAGEKLKELVSEGDELSSIVSGLHNSLNTVKSGIQLRRSRQKMLEEMEKNLEGYARSVRQILQACRRSPDFGAGIHGALAQLITVDKKYETAIEMSLGSALQNIVTSTEEDAKKAIEFLKENRLGRATFLPISSVKGRYLDEHIRKQVGELPGFCGIASDLVSCGDEYRGIILSLLGRVVVVDTLDNAIKMARKFSYSFRIVTLDGDILNTGGSISGGSADNGSTGILSRQREIRELSAQLETLQKEAEDLEEKIRLMEEQSDEIKNEIASHEKQLKDLELVKIRDESHLSQIESNMSRIAARIEMLSEEKNQLSRQEAEISAELDKYSRELEELEKEIEETKRTIEENQKSHRQEQSRRDVMYNDITDLRISVNSINESMDSIKESLSRIEKEKSAVLRDIERKNAEKEKSRREAESLSLANEGLRKQIRQMEEMKNGKMFEIDRLTEERKVLDEELSVSVESVSEINREIMLLKEEYGRIEVRRAKTEAEIESMQNRLWDEYELTYTDALQFRKDIGSITQAQRQINEYRERIRELGPVNVNAIDDYVKTRERYEFMMNQKNDLEKSEEKLRKVIYDITSKMKQQFIEQFRLINENFNIVFRELFEGGKAELRIADDSNILESGIEIIVQPPGKKLQNMMLLSGGERALTAIALLFAILRLKPTPFCVLDEIEAALDDANVYRFAEYIKKYSDRTQFIMVTHRKGTMEISDTLYGVTMQEHGISKIVSLKLDEKAS